MGLDGKWSSCGGEMERGALMVPGSGPLQFVGYEAFVRLDGNFDKAAVREREVNAFRCSECGTVQLRTRE